MELKIAKPTSVKIEGVTYTMRPGCTVPAPVLSFWRSSGQLQQLAESGTLEGYPRPRAADPTGKPEGADEKKDGRKQGAAGK
jgi:hypothetical protein